MKKILTMVALLISFNIYASPTSHSHGGRIHSHELPAQGVQHKHGSGKFGVLSKQHTALIKKQTLSRPKIIDKNGDTPLIKAAWKGKHRLVKKLIKKGAIINHQDNAGQTALHLAARFEHFDIVKTLVNSGANVNIQKNSSYTALMAAVANYDVNMVNFLLQRHASVNLVNNKGETALSIAKITGNKRIISMLKNSGAKLASGRVPTAKKKTQQYSTNLKNVRYTGIRGQVVERLKKDRRIPLEFINTLRMDYGNGVLIMYNHCDALSKENNERLKAKYSYKKRERKRNSFSWSSFMNTTNGDNPFAQKFAFDRECSSMISRMKSLAKTVNGVKEVEILEQ